MNFLVDCYHPANFLILKNAMKRLASEGHQVRWCIRSKDVLAQLLDFEKLPYEVLTEPAQGFFGRVQELLVHDAKVLSRLYRYQIDIALGASVSVAHAALLSPRTRSIVFNDDDAAVVKEFVKLGYPAANWVVTPDCLPEDYGQKHAKHPSYHVLAYLHPDHFRPDPSVLSELGLKKEDKIFLLRFVSLNAFHDTHAKGLSFQTKVEIIRKLEKLGRVFISCEGEMPAEFQPYRIQFHPGKMHSLLSYVTLLVSDSQTMTAEAAVLGVPSLRCNTFVDKLTYLIELEKRYDLTYGFLPSQQDEMFKKLDELLSVPDLRAAWASKREKLLKEKVNLADWIYQFITNTVMGKSKPKEVGHD